MSTPLPKVPNDLAVVDVAPANQTDPRVPMAEQFALQAEIGIGLFRRANQEMGWIGDPVISIADQRQVNLMGTARLPGYPKDLAIDTSALIPALSSTTAVVRQEQHLSIVGLVVDIGAEHDSSLNISFQYKNPTNTAQILSTTKENARRYRSLWLLVLSPDPLTPQAFIESIPTINGKRILSIPRTDAVGFTVESLRIYARDGNWTANKNYAIHPEYIDVCPVCSVLRMQNYLDRGYLFGNGGEEPLSLYYNILRTHRRLDIKDFDSQVRHRIIDLLAGKPGMGKAYRRTVQNLTSGAVAGNLGAPGEAAGSPDGSVCLANDQRSGFSNEARIRKWAAQVVTASNDGSGRAVVAVALNTNAPIGTRFSENPTDHKIYAADGTEQSSFGNFTSLGSNAALMWVALGSNTAITPGSTVYVVPGVSTPAGTGFSIPFADVEKVWRNGTQLSPANIRIGCNDLGAYEDPANNEEFIVVLGRERQALHYIYRRIYVSSDANGVVVIPSTERGCFAFIQNVTGRIDAPIKTGLVPNTNYAALVYYPPRSLESWQFQFRYPDYQGSLDESWLNGATVVSAPLIFAHTQGAGGSVFQGSEPLRFAPVAYHLPTVYHSIQPYHLNSMVQFAGEASLGAGAVFRELPRSHLLPGVGFTMPSIGQVLSVGSASVSQGYSMQGILNADGKPVGFRIPPLATALPYQVVVCFAVEKNGDRRLLVITRNTRGNENIAVNSDLGTAFDLFRI